MTLDLAQRGFIADLVIDWRVLLGFGAIIFIAASIRSYLRLSHVPGPLFQSISSFGLLKTHLDGNPHTDIWQWSKKYSEL